MLLESKGAGAPNILTDIVEENLSIINEILKSKKK